MLRLVCIRSKQASGNVLGIQSELHAGGVPTRCGADPSPDTLVAAAPIVRWRLCYQKRGAQTTAAELRFTFLDATTQQPVQLFQTFLTFFDLDTGFVNPETQTKTSECIQVPE